MLRLLLFPFAVLYDVVTSVRNILYDRGNKPIAHFDIPVIGVGNLAVGGTGKTPMIEYLIRLLTPSVKVATLSRGYGRKTKGFRFGSPSENASTIGDEPFQLYTKFKDHHVSVAVGEDRALAIPMILQEVEDVGVILLDDAFQHRRVRPSFQILLSDFQRPFFDDMVLPAGRLRESARGASRADVIVITKCPNDLSEEAMMKIEDRVRDFSDKPVFFSTIRYGTPIPVRYSGSLSSKVILLTGIANERPLVKYITEHFELVKSMAFADHHSYSRNEVKSILQEAEKQGAVVITTEKDVARLSSKEFEDIVAGAPIFYIPIEMEFLKNGKEFDELVLNVLTTRHAP